MSNSEYTTYEFMGLELIQRKSDEFVSPTHLLNIYNLVIRDDEEALYGFKSKTKTFEEFLEDDSNKQVMEVFKSKLKTKEDLYEFDEIGPMVHPYVLALLAQWLSPILSVRYTKWAMDNQSMFL